MAIQTVPIQTVLIQTVPTTAAQRRMYLHHRLHPADPSLNGPFGYELDGDVDPVRLRDAAARVLQAAPAMNLTFSGQGEQVLAGWDPAQRYEVPLIELAGSPSEQALAVSRYVGERADTPFDPERWPLYDIRVWAGPGRCFLTIVFSHLVCDATSLGLLFGLIRDAYLDPADEGWRQRAQDSPGTVMSDREPDPEAAEFFRRIPGAEVGSGPLAAPRGRDGALPGRMLVRRCADDVASRLLALPAGGGPSAFSVYLGAYLVLLSRLARTDQVATGIPLANRFGPRARRSLGNFVNTVPLGVDLAQYPSFLALCEDLQRTTMRLLRHQDFDPERWNAGPDGRRQPVRFGVGSAFTYYAQPLEFTLPGVRSHRLPVERGYVRAALAMAVEALDGGLTLIGDAAESLLPAAPLACYEHLLRQVGQHPAQALGRLALLPDDSPSRAERSGPTLGGSVPAGLDHWFDEVAARQPFAVAVEDATGELTYGELAAQVDRAARRLAATERARYVAVSGPRDARYVVALLAVLKAGKAFVPLDPATPAARWRQLADHFDRLPLLAGGPCPLPAEHRIELADLLRPDPGAPVDPPAPGSGPDDPAYVVFTSGTTGRPKGAQVGHRAMAGAVLAAAPYLEAGPADRWPFLHTQGFDMSVWEVLGPLLTGGRVVVVPTEVARTPAELARLVRNRGITVLSITPTAFGQLLDALPEAGPEPIAVRRLLLGGEAVFFGPLRRWFELQGDGCRVFDMYGPTETTQWVTAHEITLDDVLHEPASVIGRPRADVTVSVVDQHLHPLPVGVPGELVVAGPTLADGYVADPERTAASFITLPGGGRGYRTGDLVTMRPDGELVYHGRIDRQVQLRGYRIELGDVEHALVGVPGVRQAAVRLVDPGGPLARLVGYLVLEAPLTGGRPPAPPPDDGQLRDRLRAVLPAHMVPSLFVRLDELPLTANGKVDEEALPAPGPQPARQVPTGDPVQDRVRQVWQEVLGAASPIGPDDNFFDVGGTSMHVAGVHARLAEEFEEFDLPMVELFQHTTVRALARRLGPAPTAAAASAAPRARARAPRRNRRPV